MVAGGEGIIGAKNAADRETVAAIVVVLRIDIAAVEVQVVGIRSRVRRTRPVVAVATLIVQRAGRVIVVAGIDKAKWRTKLFSGFLRPHERDRARCCRTNPRTSLLHGAQSP